MADEDKELELEDGGKKKKLIIIIASCCGSWLLAGAWCIFLYGW